MLAELLDGLSIESLVTKQNAAEELFRRLGITFAVYAEGGSTERLIPFDLIPRILDRSEWDLVECGCLQRVKAINVFLYDIYHDQEIIKAGLVPPELVLLNPGFRPEMLGIEPSRIGIKATTTEQLGFTGRGEGLAAMASATILLPA